MTRVVLPAHLRTLAQLKKDEAQIECADPVTLGSVLDALEAKYPMLQGTVRDHVTRRRRAFVRFFVCGQDVSHESPEFVLPDAVQRGEEPLLIIGAIAGG